MSERFHILAGPTCNNNCVFCMEDDRAGRARLHEQITPARVLAQLRQHTAAGEVMFTSGEPTLNPQLARYIGWARQLGYARIGLTTNARRLGYEPYARTLLARGLTHVVVSIHGPDAPTHDAQTRTPGSFAQTLAGLAAVSRLRREYPVSLHTSTVIGRRTYRRLADLCATLAPFGVDQHVLNVMQPLGRAAPLVGRLLARYRDIVAELHRFLETAGPPRPPVYLVDLPFCTTESLPEEVRGYTEFAVFTEYEPDGRPRPRATRVHKEQPNRTKRAACAACAYDSRCLGVWRSYLDVYGWEEFSPVPTRGRILVDHCAR